MTSRKHTINISNTVWQELKRRSTSEGKDASAVIEALYHAFLSQPCSVNLPRRRSVGEEQFGVRTVFIQPDVWTRMQLWANRQDASLSGLTEHLLREHLGLGETRKQPENA